MTTSSTSLWHLHCEAGTTHTQLDSQPTPYSTRSCLNSHHPLSSSATYPPILSTSPVTCPRAALTLELETATTPVTPRSLQLRPVRANPLRNLPTPVLCLLITVHSLVPLRPTLLNPRTTRSISAVNAPTAPLSVSTFPHPPVINPREQPEKNKHLFAPPTPRGEHRSSLYSPSRSPYSPTGRMRSSSS